MKFLVDAQLPPALVTWLRHAGCAAEHVADLGLIAAADTVIASYAQHNGLTIISKDADFIVLRLPDRFGFVWLRCGNATKAALFTWLAPRWSHVVRMTSAGERFVEVR